MKGNNITVYCLGITQLDNSFQYLTFCMLWDDLFAYYCKMSG